MLRSFLRLLKRCYRLALPYGRLKLLAVLGLILLNGLLQLVGVTSVFPFFALAADPDRLRKSHFGAWLLHFLPPLSTNHLLVGAGCFAITMLVFASLGSMASEYFRIRYAYGLCYWLQQQVFESYARQPYAFFLRRNSAELIQKANDVMTFIQSVLLPVGEILSRLVLVLLLVAGVFLIQPWVALGALVIFGGFYLLVFVWLRPRTRAVGEGMKLHNVGFWRNTNQFIHGIKTVLVHGKSRHFIDRALTHCRPASGISKVKFQFTATVPAIDDRADCIWRADGHCGGVGPRRAFLCRYFTQPHCDGLCWISIVACASVALQSVGHRGSQQLHPRRIGNRDSRHRRRPTAATSSQSLALRQLTFQREIRLEQLCFQYPKTKTPTVKDFQLDHHQK